GIRDFHVTGVQTCALPIYYGNQPSFEQLYAPFKSTLSAQGIQKPIILAEFGSLATNANQTTWINQGVESIAVNFPEITHLVIFNSSIDRNVPEQLNTPILNWKITDYDHLRKIGRAHV